MKLKMVLIALIAMLLLAGCARKPTPPSPALPKIDPVAVLAQARTYYNGGVNRETNLTGLRAKAELTLNTFRTTAHDLIANNASCYTNVAAAESTIAEAVMSNQSSDAIFSALVTQSVSGEQATTACVALNQQLANFVISNRAAVQDAFLAVVLAANEYVNYTTNFPEIDFMNDLMQTYGNLSFVYQKLADNGIGVSDWSWLPTENLRINMGSNKARCDYYLTGAFKANLRSSQQRKFTGHEDALMSMYEAEWDPTANGGKGLCTLYRYAALKEMTISPLSSDTQDVLQNNTDQGIFPTETPAP